MQQKYDETFVEIHKEMYFILLMVLFSLIFCSLFSDENKKDFFGVRCAF